MQSWCPAEVWQWGRSKVNRPDLSKPLGTTNDWNFNAWTRLWPLYTKRWFSSGLEIGLTVPSTKPKQLGRGEPIQRIVWAYCSRHAGVRNCCFQDVSRWQWLSKTQSNTTLWSVQIDKSCHRACRGMLIVPGGCRVLPIRYKLFLGHVWNVSGLVKPLLNVEDLLCSLWAKHSSELNELRQKSLFSQYR